MMIQPSEQLTALDAFMEVSLDSLHQFAHGSTEVRGHLEATEGTLLVPLRGAAPLLWTAEGQQDSEESPTQDLRLIDVPTGAAYQTRLYIGDVPNATRLGRTRADTRKRIIEDALAEVSAETAGITILDEVQLGDRVTTLAKMSVKSAFEKGIALPVRVIAAEGELREAGRDRLVRYTQLRNGDNPDIGILPVAIPLIGVDRQELLPTITHNYAEYTRRERTTVITPNPEAEKLFRLIGSMARRTDAAQDESSISDLIGALPTQHPSEEVSAWTSSLIEKFSV